MLKKLFIISLLIPSLSLANVGEEKLKSPRTEQSIIYKAAKATGYTVLAGIAIVSAIPTAPAAGVVSGTGAVLYAGGIGAVKLSTAAVTACLALL